MKSVLKFPVDNPEPELLQLYYHGGVIHPALLGLPLQHWAIDLLNETLDVCSSCLRCIESARLPKFAIANGFFIGEAPECLTDLNRTELAMINKCIPYMYITTVRGGQHMRLRSHAYMFKGNTAIAESLPNDVIEKSAIKVTIVSATTPLQRASLANSYEATPAKVLSAYGWLRENNCEYANIAMDPNMTDTCHRINALVIDELEDEQTSRILDDSLTRHNLPSNHVLDDESDENVELSRPNLVFDAMW